MSTTLARVRFLVRERLRETDGRRASLDPIELDECIADSLIELGSFLGPIPLLTESAFTIAANAQTFSLPASVPTGFVSTPEYAAEVRIRRRSDGQFLRKRTLEEIHLMRDGDTSTTGSGKPEEFALYEDGSQVIQGECYPRPSGAETCDLFRALTFDDLRDHATDIEAATIMLSRQGVVALVLWAAADLLLRMIPDDAALRRMDQRVAGDWRMRAQRLLYAEEARRQDLRAIGRPLRVEV